MKKTATNLSEEELDSMVEEAIIDCCDEYEQEAGFCATLQDMVHMPFTTKIFGLDVSVVSIEQGDDGIYAMCKHGKDKQEIPLTKLPLPSPAPEGAEWIEAYRHFRGCR